MTIKMALLEELQGRGRPRARSQPTNGETEGLVAVRYRRVSSEEQAIKDLSIPAQGKLIDQYVESQPSIRVVEDFKDEGESAYAPADRRTGFCEMISYCRKNRVDLILVHKLDRFSRNREESILFKSLLKRQGTTVKSVTEHFDPETPQGFLYEGMIEVINQFYSMNLATETMKGMRENAERGYHNGGVVPFGYRAKKVQDKAGREHSVLVPGPEAEVALVRRIFSWAVVDGIGIKSIANRLNAEGVTSPRGKRWTLSCLGNILNNPIYTGRRIWNRRSKGRWNDPKDWVVIEATHEPLIPAELFEARKKVAQEREFNLTRSPKKYVRYLLARLIYCADCQGTYVGRRQLVRSRAKATWREPHQLERYICGNYLRNGRSVCRSLMIHRDYLDDAARRLIREQLFAPGRLDRIEGLVKEELEGRRAAFLRSNQGADAKLATIDRKIQNLYDAIADGLNPQTCKAKIQDLEREKVAIEAQAEMVRREDFYKTAIETNLHAVREVAEKFDTELDALPFDRARQVVLHFIDRVTIIDRRIARFRLKVPLDPEGLKRLVAPPPNGSSSSRNGEARAEAASFRADAAAPGNYPPPHLRGFGGEQTGKSSAGAAIAKDPTGKGAEGGDYPSSPQRVAIEELRAFQRASEFYPSADVRGANLFLENLSTCPWRRKPSTNTVWR